MPNNFGPKLCMSQKIFVQKNYGHKKNLSKTGDVSQKKNCKKLFYEKEEFDEKICGGKCFEKKFGQCWSNKSCGLKKFLGPA